MLSKRSLYETLPVKAGCSFWANPKPAVISDVANLPEPAAEPMFRNGLFRKKADQRDRPLTARSGKYPFKWTILGLVVFCSAFWMALAFLIFR